MRTADTAITGSELLNMVRSPEMVALDMSSMIACNNVAKDRMLALIDKYGYETVDEACRTLIDQSETLLLDLNNIVSTAVGAASPTDPRAVLVATTFGEDMVVVNTDGASGFLEGFEPSGPPPEGDKARTGAISPDGSMAVAVNLFSDNASLVDLTTDAVTIVDIGDRPAEVEFTPDGTKAVVAVLDEFYTSIIDVAGQTVTNVGIGRRAGQVEISPDGQFAYLAVVADGDGVWRIAHRVVVHDWSTSTRLDDDAFPLPMDAFVQGTRDRSDLVYRS